MSYLKFRAEPVKPTPAAHEELFSGPVQTSKSSHPRACGTRAVNLFAYNERRLEHREERVPVEPVEPVDPDEPTVPVDPVLPVVRVDPVDPTDTLQLARCCRFVVSPSTGTIDTVAPVNSKAQPPVLPVQYSFYPETSNDTALTSCSQTTSGCKYPLNVNASTRASHTRHPCWRCVTGNKDAIRQTCKRSS